MSCILVVTGARDLGALEKARAAQTLNLAVKEAALVIHGAARGVDALAAHVASIRGVKALAVPVASGEWPTARNTRMLALALEEARARGLKLRVIALPTLASRGTWDTWRKAVKLRAEHPELFDGPPEVCPLSLSGVGP